MVYHNESQEGVDPQVNNFMSIGGVTDKDLQEYGTATQTSLKTATINFDSGFKPYAACDTQSHLNNPHHQPQYYKTLDSDEVHGFFSITEHNQQNLAHLRSVQCSVSTTNYLDQKPTQQDNSF